MTTVAASVAEGVMCSDSQWSDGIHKGLMRKVFRIRGSLIGVAGDMRQIVEWVAAWKDDPRGRHKQSIHALILSAEGLSTWDNTQLLMPTNELYQAIGSGADFALGAMDQGASCREAVRIACRRDASSGPPVRTYKLR
jgi:20S proteasome alpha/beta subunit